MLLLSIWLWWSKPFGDLILGFFGAPHPFGPKLVGIGMLTGGNRDFDPWVFVGNLTSFQWGFQKLLDQWGGIDGVV